VPANFTLGKDPVVPYTPGAPIASRSTALSPCAASRSIGDQLLQPRAQVVDLRRGEDGDLVPSGVGGRTRIRPSATAGLSAGASLAMSRPGRLVSSLPICNPATVAGARQSSDSAE